MANSITIDIDAKDNASGIIGGVFDLIRNNASVFDVVATAAIGAANFTREAVQAAFDYDQQIYGLSLSTGATVEQTSRLVQVLDDAGVGFDVVKKAMREMSKDGVEPNIQELARLSDEFLTLNTGAERGKFLLDHFGKSGEDMARAMALGGDNILSMNDAIEGNLIVTQKAIDEAEKYRKNIDQLNDSWSAFKVGIGNDIIPIMNDAIQSQLNWNDAVEQAREELNTTNPHLVNQYAAMLMQQQAANDSAASTIHYSETVRDAANSTTSFGGAVALTTAELNEMTKANNSQLSLVKRLQVDTDNYNKSLAETVKQFGEGSEEVKQLQADHEAAMQAIAYDLYVAKLQADGFTDAEFEMALAAGIALGQIDPKTAAIARGLDKAAQNALAVGTNIRAAGQAADALAGDYYVTIHTSYVYDGNPPGPLCFITGTPVLSGNEHKPIETLQVGDFVRSYDTERGEYADVSIARIFKRKVSSYLLINGIGVTVEHPFYANGEWVKAGDLKIGDVLLSETGDSVEVASISTEQKDATVYNIETGTEPHNYFAGGVLVHNKTLNETGGSTQKPTGGYAMPEVGSGGGIDYLFLQQVITAAIVAASQQIGR